MNQQCLLISELETFEPQIEDILTDSGLLELFRIVKQVIGRNPDSERLAKSLFCISFALGDHVRFIKPCHEDKIVFQHHSSPVYSVRLPPTSSCCNGFNEMNSEQNWIESACSVTTPMTLISPVSPLVNNQSPSVPCLNHHSPLILTSNKQQPFSLNYDHNNITTPVISTVSPTPPSANPLLMSISEDPNRSISDMEPQQRGFYYQEGRITQEPVLLQRYAEQGILTQASLMKKKRKSVDSTSFESPKSKKPKIPHRHGEFESRRDDIIQRLKNITMAELEQKAQRLPHKFTLAIDQSVTADEANILVASGSFSNEQVTEVLLPALHILTNHANMKPHLDNGMNQNGIYYNSDYFRLFLAFEQFQQIFSILFPSVNEDLVDKDRERNNKMKSYRPWIEPHLTGTNWAAFRRNIVVGERMRQLTQSIGQGVLLMTKELSGSKLHLTFTNSEWDEWLEGLNSGRWGLDLLRELESKFKSIYWFDPEGRLVSPKQRRLLIHDSTVSTQKNMHLSF